MQFDKIISKKKDKIVYKNGDLAIKVFDKTYSKTDVINEAHNQARIEETNLKIPHVRQIFEAEEGKWAIASDFIEGKTLEALMREIPEEKEKYLDKFIDIQLEIQSKRSPQLTKLKDKVHSKINDSSLDDDTKLELYTRLESMPMYKNVLHGDLDPSNVVVTDDNEIYVLDWSHTTQGNPAHDIARTYLLFKLKKQDDLAELYLKRVCEKTGLEKNQIKRWFPLVATAQALNGKQDEWPLLKSWIDMVNDDE